MVQYFIIQIIILKLNGELFLIDAGCEYFNYASDITRTYGIGEINEYKKLIDLVSNINLNCKLLVKENMDFKDII